MKIFILCILWIAIVNINVTAQSKQELKVKAAVSNLYQAMIDANETVLNQLTHAKLSYGHSGGAVDDKKIFVEKIVSGKSDFVKIDNEIESIAIDKNIALVRHKLAATTNDNGKPGEVNLKILLIFKKKNGKWLLIGRQAVKA